MKVALPPASLVLPLIAETVTPAVSSSGFVTLTVPRPSALVEGVGAVRGVVTIRRTSIVVVHKIVHAGDRYRAGTRVPVAAGEVALTMPSETSVGSSLLSPMYTVSRSAGW